MTPSSLRDELVRLLSTIPGVRVYPNLIGEIDPPAVMVNLPSMTFAGFCDSPTSVEFEVVYLVKMDDRATDRVLDSVPLIFEALDSTFVVTSAEPTVLESNGTPLAGYRFLISA